ncbi:MAG TPA: cytochrome c [Blastocatellia bacterium]|nr:cytochrome c [Blastocatellia bacterium]
MALSQDKSSAHEPITTKMMFDKEIVRILQASCLGCHRPGGIAMSLATYDEARPWAKAIKEELLGRRMPPWTPVPGYGDFRNAPPISQRDIDMIVNWVEGGAPRGDPKDLPSEPLYTDDWQLGAPDLVLKLKTEAAVGPDADEYRTFELPTGLSQDRWLRAIDLRPGNTSVVWSAEFYLQCPAQAHKREAGQGSQPESEKSAARLELLGTWRSGQETIALPDGAGQLTPAGSRIVVKIHYHGSGETAKDQSAVGLYFAGTGPLRPVTQVSLDSADAVVPAGATCEQVKASYTLQNDADLLAIKPLAVPLLLSLEATAYKPDGTVQVLTWTLGSKFDWQPVCYLREPIRLPRGTRVEAIAYFDNSDGNRNNPNNPPKPIRMSDFSPDSLCNLTLVDVSGKN